MTAAAWLVTSAQGSGKSTVAELLAREFARGVHVRGGQFYRWVVRGWVPFDGPDQTEALRLLELRYRLSAQTAATYVDAGFTCVVQDNIYGRDVLTWLEALAPRPVHLVVLRPPPVVVAERDAERRARTRKIAYRGGSTPEVNDAHLARTPRLGLWLDTSGQTPAETVAEILRRRTEARVG